MKIKIFDYSDEESLEKEINNFIDERNIKVIDIKFSTSHFAIDEETQAYCYSALVMYQINDDTNDDFERIVHPERYYEHLKSKGE